MTDEIPPDDPYTESTPDPLVLLERSVIGTAMAFPHGIPELTHEVAGGDFHDMRLGRIFRGLVDEHAEGRPVDYLSVSDLLAGWDVRGIDLRDLSNWSDTATDPGVGAHHARLVRAASIRRLLANVGQTLQTPGADLAVAAQDAIEQLHTIGSIGGGKGQPLRWLSDILSVPESEDVYDWVIPDVVERRDRLMLTAGEGLGKSVWLRQCAMLTAAGIHPFTFSPVEPIQALVVDVENSERQWRRAVRRMADQAEQKGVRDPRSHVAVEFLPKSDITNPSVLAAIHRRIDEVKPDLVVIGPVYRLAPEIKGEEQAAPVLAALDSIRDRDVAMLIEAHAGHATSKSGERDLRPRGSSALLGWPEFGIGLRKDAERGVRQTFSLVRWRGDRDARQFPARFVRGQVWPWEPSF